MTGTFRYRAFPAETRLKPTGNLFGPPVDGGGFRDLGTYTRETEPDAASENPIHMEFVIVPKRRRDPLLSFRRREQDPATENRKQRRAREAKERRSKHA